MGGCSRWVVSRRPIEEEWKALGEVANLSSFVSITLGKDTRHQGDGSGSAAVSQAVRKGD